jgi:molybdopterin molybdotransferase
MFHGVAQRPGKPILGGSLPGGPLVLGLPGNPVSTVVGLRFFVVPLLRSWLGLSAERPLAAALERTTDKPAGLRCFFKAVVRAAPRGLSVRVLAGQASFQVAPLLRANAWAILPERGSRVVKGSRVDVLPWLPGDFSFPA